MGLVTSTEMFKKAYKEGYAIGGFNVNNMEIIQGIVEAAVETNSPVILQVSSSAIKYARMNYLIKMVEAAVESTTIPIALHLDHGPDFETCKMCIDAGFTSVMIDGSHHPIDENIRMTKEVVDYAHAMGASVEAEVGTVGGNEDGVIGGIKYADLNECVRLVKEAGVDALAPALGSVHGPYQGEPVLGFVEMEAIGKATDMPLVLHGGTGIPDEKIQKAISCGTCKINVNTECQLAFNKILREFLADEKNAKVYDPRKLLTPATKGIQAAVTEKMNVFGSVNKSC